MSQQINLFNPVFLQQKKMFSARTMALALGVLVLGVAALHLYGNARVNALQAQADTGADQLKKAEARLAAVTAEFAPRQKNPALENELAEAERQLAALRQVSGVLERGELGNTRGHAETFRALARQHVDGLWLTGVSVGGDGKTGEPGAIAVHGRALDPNRVPGYLNRLTREPVLQGKAFASMQIQGAAPVEGGSPGAKAPAAAPAYVEFSLSSAMEGAKP
ncbi:PilN domain-containing protein [Massilia sp. GCM10023247]|uniref:PilN domain-containing protein n=1 Tax=Massilia sp. GCM10023247 TaxID=3252643 RepID=UPI00361EECCD